MDKDKTLLEFIDNDIKHYKEILLYNKHDENIQTYYKYRLDCYNKLKEIVNIHNAIITKQNKPLKEKDYTLEEVKKMWEEAGFDVEVTNRFIYTDRLESNNDFIFDKLELRCHSHSGWMNIELFDLITKTLKALEKEKGKQHE